MKKIHIIIKTKKITQDKDHEYEPTSFPAQKHEFKYEDPYYDEHGSKCASMSWTTVFIGFIIVIIILLVVL